MAEVNYLNRNMKDDITHWEATPSGYGGFDFLPPVSVKGRWQDSIELLRSDSGDSFSSRAKVGLDTDVTEGDYLFLGVSAEADPANVDGAFRVMRFDKTPDLRSIKHRRVAYL